MLFKYHLYVYGCELSVFLSVKLIAIYHQTRGTTANLDRNCSYRINLVCAILFHYQLTHTQCGVT